MFHRVVRRAVVVLPIALALASLGLLILAALASAGGPHHEPAPFRWS